MANIGGDDLTQHAQSFELELQALAEKSNMRTHIESGGAKRLLFDKAGNSHAIKKGILGSFQAKIRGLKTFEQRFAKDIVSLGESRQKLLQDYLGHVKNNTDVVNDGKIGQSIAKSIKMFDQIITAPYVRDAKEKASLDSASKMIMDGLHRSGTTKSDDLYTEVIEPLINKQAATPVNEKLTLIDNGYKLLSQHSTSTSLTPIEKSCREILDSQLNECSQKLQEEAKNINQQKVSPQNTLNTTKSAKHSLEAKIANLEQKGPAQLESALKTLHFEAMDNGNAKTLIEGAAILLDVHNGKIQEDEGLKKLSSLGIFTELPQEGLKEKAMKLLTSEYFLKALNGAKEQVAKRKEELEELTKINIRKKAGGIGKRSSVETTYEIKAKKLEIKDNTKALQTEIETLNDAISKNAKALEYFLGATTSKYGEKENKTHYEYLMFRIEKEMSNRNLKYTPGSFQGVPNDVLKTVFSPREAFSRTELARMVWVENKIKEELGNSYKRPEDIEKIPQDRLNQIFQEASKLSKKELKNQGMHPSIISDFIDSHNILKGIEVSLAKEQDVQRLHSNKGALFDSMRNTFKRSGLDGTIEDWMTKDVKKANNDMKSYLKVLQKEKRPDMIHTDRWKQNVIDRAKSVEIFRRDFEVMKEYSQRKSEAPTKQQNYENAIVMKSFVSDIESKCSSLHKELSSLQHFDTKIEQAEKDIEQAELQMKALHDKEQEIQQSLNKLQEIKSTHKLA